MTIAQFEPQGDPRGSSGFRVNLESRKIPVREHVVLKIDVSTIESLGQIESECKRHAEPDAMVKINLCGVPAFGVDSERLQASLREHFFWAEIEDESNFLKSRDIARFAEEPTIRGHFVRRLLNRLEAAGSAREREVLELALRKGLSAFEGR